MERSKLQPWDRLTDESQIAYSAFRIYLESQPPRSQLATYRTYSGLPHAKWCGGGFTKWVTKYNWDERANYYDAWINDKKLKETIAAIESQSGNWLERQNKNRNRFTALAETMAEKAEIIFRFPLVEKIITAQGAALIIRPIRIADLAVAGKLACDALTMCAKLGAVRLIDPMAEPKAVNDRLNELIELAKNGSNDNGSNANGSASFNQPEEPHVHNGSPV
jgi:hypothetical protein